MPLRLGFEGVTWHQSTNTFYTVQEMSPTAIFKISGDGATVTTVNADLKTGGLLIAGALTRSGDATVGLSLPGTCRIGYCSYWLLGVRCVTGCQNGCHVTPGCQIGYWLGVRLVIGCQNGCHSRRGVRLILLGVIDWCFDCNNILRSANPTLRTSCS